VFDRRRLGWAGTYAPAAWLAARAAAV
jgi:hypothetical protein